MTPTVSHLKHKLLEVHYATRNADDVRQCAGTGNGRCRAGSVDEDAWARALDMGRELAPDNPLFAQATGRRGAKLAGLAAAAAAAGRLPRTWTTTPCRWTTWSCLS